MRQATANILWKTANFLWRLSDHINYGDAMGHKYGTPGEERAGYLAMGLPPPGEIWLPGKHSFNIDARGMSPAEVEMRVHASLAAAHHNAGT